MRRSVVLAALTGKDGHEQGTHSKGTGAEQRTAIGGGFGPLLGRKPFRTPSLKSDTDEITSQGRKRRRVNYTGMDEGEEAGTSKDVFVDAEQDQKALRGKSGKKFEVTWKGVDAAGRSLKADNRKWPVFQTKENALQRRFNIPVMKNQKGETIETRLTTVALGMRRPIDVPPRPLHDPMAEHAIVLFDPTVDDREAELRKQELQRQQEAVEQEIQQERAIKAGPHKKLSDILGLSRRKVEVAVKVPVVIDPLLAKVLRPHQIEGVKVGCSNLLPKCAHRLTAACSFSIAALQVSSLKTHMGEPFSSLLCDGYANYSSQLHHGRRNGPWKNFAVHQFDVDASQTVANPRKTDDRQVHHCVSFEPGSQLGERIGQMARKFGSWDSCFGWQIVQDRGNGSGETLVRCERAIVSDSGTHRFVRDASHFDGQHRRH